MSMSPSAKATLSSKAGELALIGPEGIKSRDELVRLHLRYKSAVVFL